MGWISLWMERCCDLVHRRNLDILERLQIKFDFRSSALSFQKNESQPRPFTSPWNLWRQTRVFPQLTGWQLAEDHARHLNRDTVDADAVPGISTDIAYNQEYNGFFLRPL
jgi:hypothetical protein